MENKEPKTTDISIESTATGDPVLQAVDPNLIELADESPVPEESGAKENEAEQEVSTAPVSKPRKRWPVWCICLVVLLSLAFLTVGAGAAIVQPWIAYEAVEYAPPLIVTVPMETVAIGDTVQLEVPLADNESVFSFVSDMPQAIAVDESGSAAALAGYPATVRAVIKETAVIIPALTPYQQFRSELRIWLGIDPYIDYTALEPRELYYYDFAFSAPLHPINETDIEIELTAGQEADLEVDLEDGQTFKAESGDSAVLEIDGLHLKAVAEGETTLTVIVGMEVAVGGETVFMPLRADVYAVKVSEAVGGKNNTGSGSGGTTLNPNKPQTGSGGTGGSSGGSGGGSGNGGTQIGRRYPLPSESEVAAFVQAALGYANSIGLGTNYSLHTGNSGYMSPACTWELPWSTVQGDVYWQIDQVRAMATGDSGFQSGMAVINIAYAFYNGEYYIYVMWG